MAGMEQRSRLNHKRNRLKSKEKQALAKAINPCFGLFKCACREGDPDREEAMFPVPIDCPVATECLEEYCSKTICREYVLNEKWMRTTRTLRKAIEGSLKRTYLSHGRKTKTKLKRNEV